MSAYYAYGPAVLGAPPYVWKFKTAKERDRWVKQERCRYPITASDATRVCADDLKPRKPVKVELKYLAVVAQGRRLQDGEYDALQKFRKPYELFYCPAFLTIEDAEELYRYRLEITHRLIFMDFIPALMGALAREAKPFHVSVPVQWHPVRDGRIISYLPCKWEIM